MVKKSLCNVLDLLDEFAANHEVAPIDSNVRQRLAAILMLIISKKFLKILKSQGDEFDPKVH